MRYSDDIKLVIKLLNSNLVCKVLNFLGALYLVKQ